jgi:hypothetical protein
VQVVTRADRKDVIEYLTRERLDKPPASINTSIAAQVPVRLTRDQLQRIDEKRLQ